MEQINVAQSKGGQGTSVVACAVALRAAGEGRQVRLDGLDRDTLASILGGAHGDGAVVPGLFLGADNGERFDLVVHDGPADGSRSVLVTRPCYLALRRAIRTGATTNACGIVVVDEPGRSLDGDDVSAITGLPVIATVPLRRRSLGRSTPECSPTGSPNRWRPPPVVSSPPC